MHSCDKLTNGLFKSDAGGGCGGAFRGVPIMKRFALGVAALAAALAFAPSPARAITAIFNFTMTFDESGEM